MSVAKVNCELCGQEISKSNYSKHLRRHQNRPESFNHQVNIVDQENLCCIFCNKQWDTLKGLIQHQVYCKSNPNRKQSTIEKYGSINGFNNKGRVAWNKGLTVDSDERVRKSVETYQINKQLGKHKDTRGHKNSMSKPGAKEKLSVSMKQVYSEQKPKVSGRSKHGWYKGIWCDSTWELAFVLYALDNNINFVRNNKGFSYIWSGSVHTYYPDFYLPDENTYIEIKGYCDKRATEKHKQFQYSLIVYDRNLMKPILEYVQNKYGSDIENLYDK